MEVVLLENASQGITGHCAKLRVPQATTEQDAHSNAADASLRGKTAISRTGLARMVARMATREMVA